MDAEHRGERAGRKVFVSDFDGTMTDVDFFELAREQLIPADTPDYWQDYLAGRLTLFEVLASIFGAIRADEATVLRVMQQAELDPQLGAGVRRLERAGWQVEVASAGCAWYIERLLAQQGVELVVHANPGRFEPGRGLQMSHATGSPYYSERAGIDKGAIVRDALARAEVVAFAGDSLPDLQAALAVPPERRFARAALARELESRGERFQRYGRWSEIVEHLLRESAG